MEYNTNDREQEPPGEKRKENTTPIIMNHPYSSSSSLSKTNRSRVGSASSLSMSGPTAATATSSSYSSSWASLEGEAMPWIPKEEDVSESDYGHYGEASDQWDIHVSPKKNHRSSSSNGTITVRVADDCACTCKRKFLAHSTVLVGALWAVMVVVTWSQGDILYRMTTPSSPRATTTTTASTAATTVTRSLSAAIADEDGPASAVSAATDAVAAGTTTTTTANGTKLGLHIVVSHCDEPLQWIWDQYLVDLDDEGPPIDHRPWKSFTILTKCGKPPSPESLPPPTLGPSVNVVALPNVGRCDHSYAYWINQLFLEPTQRHPTLINITAGMVESDQVLFMKGNDNQYRGEWENEFSLHQMRTKASEIGFACATEIHAHREFHKGEVPTNIMEGWTLGTFLLETYTGARKEANEIDFWAPHRPLANWLTHFGPEVIEFPLTTQYFRVCFGGQFLTSVHRLQLAPVYDWDPILQSLSRGDNIEEGHFMERLWAGLLSPPLPPAEQQRLHSQRVRVFTQQAYTGLLVLGQDKMK